MSAEMSAAMNTPPFWNKILVPTDFSDDSFSALREAGKFLQAHDTLEVVLLHVTAPVFEGLRIHTTESQREVNEQARQALQRLASEHFPHDSHVTTLIKEGHAGETICDTASTCGVDAILIATRGRTGLKHFLLGSIAEKVVRHAPCSVLVVR